MSIILSRFRSTLDRSTSKGHVLRGALAAFTVRALGIVVAYLVQVLLAWWTGPTRYGLYVYAWTWLTVLAMVVPIGLNEAILRFVPTRGCPEKRRCAAPRPAGERHLDPGRSGAHRATGRRRPALEFGLLRRSSELHGSQPVAEGGLAS